MLKSAVVLRGQFCNIQVFLINTRATTNKKTLPIFGEQFISWQNGLERVTGIVTAPLYYVVQMGVSLLNIGMMVIDALCEATNGKFGKATARLKEIPEQMLYIPGALILAVVSLFVNLFDAGFGIGNTAMNCITTHALS